jgi:type IV secretory pathway VirB2 component (pilin)
MQNKTSTIAAFVIVAFMTCVPLYAGYNIESHGSSSGTIFARIVRFMQDTVDLLDGPIAIAVVVISLIAALILWNMAPGRSEWVGRTLRAVVSGILIMDIALIVNYLRS